MGIRLRLGASLSLALAAPLLLGATQTPPELAGEGVLCLGGYVYMADLVGRSCYPGLDSAFQSRVAGYAARFDQYITRNGGGQSGLDRFKADERMSLDARPDLCENEGTLVVYDALRDADQAELQSQVDQVLSRDGAPSYGACT